MIDINVAFLGFADSFNLLLWLLIALGYSSKVKRPRISVVIFSDWLGIVAATGIVFWVIKASYWTPPHAAHSPVLGILLICLGAIGLATRKRHKVLLQKAKYLAKRLYASVLNASAIGFSIGFIQSVTSIPFLGGIFTLAREEDVKMMALSMRLCSLLAISTSVVIFFAGFLLDTSSRDSAALSGKGSTLTAAVLTITGILLLLFAC